MIKQYEKAYNFFLARNVDVCDLSTWSPYEDVKPFIDEYISRITDDKFNCMQFLSKTMFGIDLRDIFIRKDLDKMILVYNALTGPSVSAFYKIIFIRNHHISYHGTHIIVTPKACSDATRDIFFIHGGALIAIQVYGYVQLFAKIVAEMNVRVIVLNYITNGNVAEIADFCLGIIKATHNSSHGLIVCSESSGATIANRLLYLFRTTEGLERYLDGTRLIYIYPAMCEIDSISPGRFATISYIGLANIMFYEMISRRLVLAPTILSEPTGPMGNVKCLVCACTKDGYIDDQLYLYSFLKKKLHIDTTLMLLDKEHGFLIADSIVSKLDLFRDIKKWLVG